MHHFGNIFSAASNHWQWIFTNSYKPQYNCWKFMVRNKWGSNMLAI